LLPRAAQIKNVLISIYKLERILAVHVPTKHFFTHAWLPKDKFDQVVERDGWIFVRRGDGFLALHSMKPYSWQEKPGDDQWREVIAPGRKNIWICQLGRKAVDGTFENFIQYICSAKLSFNDLNIEYESPGNGLLSFGWEEPLSLDGVDIPLKNYPRYDNPYVKVPFAPTEISVKAREHELYLNWETGERITS
jgi:hypothetical protein